MQRASIQIPLWAKLTIPILLALIPLALPLPETKWFLFAAGMTLRQTTWKKPKINSRIEVSNHGTSSGVTQISKSESVVRRRDFLKLSSYVALAAIVGLIAARIPSVAADPLTPVRRYTAPTSASYVIFIDPADGNKIKVKETSTGLVKFSSADGGFAMQKSIDALPSGGVILMQPGTYTWSSVPAFPPNLQDWLKITGDAGAIIQLTSLGPRAFDFSSGGAGQTFKNISIESLQIDCNNVGGKHHVILGTWVNGAGRSDINIDNIVLRNITTYNVPVDPSYANQRWNIWLVLTWYVGEPQRSITNILIEDLDLHGGNEGIAICANGDLGSGSTAVGPLKNVFIDNINVFRCHHTLLNPPTMFFYSNNVQIGGTGYGGSCHIADCHGEFSGDDGIEVNGMTNAIVESCSVANAFAEAFYCNNFNGPQTPNSQQIVIENCIATGSSQTLSNTMSRGFVQTTAPGIPMGSISFLNCQYNRNYPHSGQFSGAEAISLNATSGLQYVLISGFQAYIQGDYACTSFSSLVGIFVNTGSASGASVNISQAEIHVSGKRNSGSADLVWDGLELDGNDATLALEDIVVDMQITNSSTNGLVGINLGPNPNCKMSGTIQNLKIAHMLDDSQPFGVIVRGQNTLTIPTQIQIESSDFSGISSGVHVLFISPSNASKVKIG
jgi:hypothetical protein